MTTDVQLFKSRLERGRRLIDRLAHPWRFCRCCGDEMPRGTQGLCDSCEDWAGVIIRAHESARVRARFQ